jgi:hypothetical protein
VRLHGELLPMALLAEATMEATLRSILGTYRHQHDVGAGPRSTGEQLDVGVADPEQVQLVLPDGAGSVTHVAPRRPGAAEPAKVSTRR